MPELVTEENGVVGKQSDIELGQRIENNDFNAYVNNIGSPEPGLEYANTF